MWFFRLDTWALTLILFGVVLGAAAVGFLVGRSQRHRSDHLRDPVTVLQTALLGLVGLILAFSLALAVGRHEARRAAVVDDANAIDTTYLRAQTLPEPMRTRSMELLVEYTDASIALSEAVPGSDESLAIITEGDALHRELWALAGEALEVAPTDSAPRGLYVDSLNEMIDQQTVRVSALNNRVPPPVLVLEVAGASVVVGLVAFLVALLGRGPTTPLLAAVLLSFVLVVTFDLDRPTRGLIRVPDKPLVDVRLTMDAPPAADAP